jgi:hypothetical protein
MARGQSTRWVACAAVCAIGASGCSAILDWDAKPDAGPALEACNYKEPNDAIATPQPLAVGEVGPAAICPAADRDFYLFTVPADGSTVTLRITFDDATEQDLDMNLYVAATGMLLSQGVSFNMPEERIVCPGVSPNCAALTTGDYVLEVFGAGPATFNTYALELSIVP